MPHRGRLQAFEIAGHATPRHVCAPATLSACDNTALAVALAASTAAADRHRRLRAPDDPHPHAVTQRFLLKLAAGTWRLADYVDPAAGVVYLDVEQGLGDHDRDARRAVISRR